MGLPTIPSFRGSIEFYSGNNASGSNIYTITDSAGQSINMKSIGKNDVTRSLKLVNCATGIVIKIYDHGDAAPIDDWGEIEVLKQVPSCIVGTFERDYTDPDGVYRQTYHKKDGLDGRVSHIKTMAAPPLQLDYLALGKLFSLSGWNDISGLASRFKSQDWDYRIYQPDTAPALNSSGEITGTAISTQLDVIRSGTDDHCYARIEIGLDGTITSDLDYVWNGQHIGLKVLGKVATWVASQIGDLAAGWVGSKMAEYACKLVGESMKASAAKVNNGRRLNLTAVVGHSINKIVQATRATTTV